MKQNSPEMSFKERDGGTVPEGWREGAPEVGGDMALKDLPPRVDSLVWGDSEELVVR